TTSAARSCSTPSPDRDVPMSFTTTFAPRRPSSRAWARPRPPPAPVTTATRPSKLGSTTLRSTLFLLLAACTGPFWGLSGPYRGQLGASSGPSGPARGGATGIGTSRTFARGSYQGRYGRGHSCQAYAGGLASSAMSGLQQLADVTAAF